MLQCFIDGAHAHFVRAGSDEENVEAAGGCASLAESAHSLPALVPRTTWAETFVSRPSLSLNAAHSRRKAVACMRRCLHASLRTGMALRAAQALATPTTDLEDVALRKFSPKVAPWLPGCDFLWEGKGEVEQIDSKSMLYRTVQADTLRQHADS